MAGRFLNGVYIPEGATIELARSEQSKYMGLMYEAENIALALEKEQHEEFHKKLSTYRGKEASDGK